MKSAQIHRFRQLVALNMPAKGETVYLTPKQAKQIARALNACARSVKNEPTFSTSTFADVEIELGES